MNSRKQCVNKLHSKPSFDDSWHKCEKLLQNTSEALMSSWTSTGAAMEDQSPHILKRPSRLCPTGFHHGPSSGIRVDECWRMKVRGHLYCGIVILLDTPTSVLAIMFSNFMTFASKADK